MGRNKSETQKGSTDIISLRLGNDLLERVKRVQEAIQKKRGTGAKEVSRTEAVQILIEIGIENFKANQS